MIAQNEINVQGEFPNKTDSRTVSYKYRTARILVQLNNSALQLFHTRQ